MSTNTKNESNVVFNPFNNLYEPISNRYVKNRAYQNENLSNQKNFSKNNLNKKITEIYLG